MTENQKSAASVVAMVAATAIVIVIVHTFFVWEVGTVGQNAIPSHLELKESSVDEFGQKQRRETQTQTGRGNREAGEGTTSARRPKDRYYRDSHGAIMSERETENKLRQLRRRINSMPDSADRAYLEGVLRAFEAEWTRIKLQGPIVKINNEERRAY